MESICGTFIFSSRLVLLTLTRTIVNSVFLLSNYVSNAFDTCFGLKPNVTTCTFSNCGTYNFAKPTPIQID